MSGPHPTRDIVHKQDFTVVHDSGGFKNVLRQRALDNTCAEPVQPRPDHIDRSPPKPDQSPSGSIAISKVR